MRRQGRKAVNESSKQRVERSGPVQAAGACEAGCRQQSKEKSCWVQRGTEYRQGCTEAALYVRMGLLGDGRNQQRSVLLASRMEWRLEKGSSGA